MGCRDDCVECCENEDRDCSQSSFDRIADDDDDDDDDDDSSGDNDDDDSKKSKKKSSTKGTENSGDTGSTNKARCRQKCEKKETGADLEDCKSKCESATEKSPTKGTEKSA